MKPKLIHNWRDAPKMFSMQAAAAALTVQTGWLGVPDAIRASLPGWMPTAVAWVVVGLTGACMLGRLVQQFCPPEAGASEGFTQGGKP